MYRRNLCAVSLLCILLCLSGCAETSGGTGSSTYSGMDYINAGDYASAVETLQQVTEGGSASEDDFRLLGIALMGTGDYDSAVTAFKNALSLAGSIPSGTEYDINFYLGSCYYRLGRYEEALDVYDAIIGLRPGDADAYMFRGTVSLAMGDVSSMERDYQKAIDLEPDQYDRIVQIFQKCEDAGYDKIGQELLQEVLDRQSDSIDNYNRGRLAFYAGDYTTAKSALEKTGTITDYSVAIMLGKTYEKLGDFNYATSVYESFLQRDSTHAEVYNQLGLCYMSMGDYEQALSTFQQGLEIQDSDVRQGLLFNEIVAYENLGEFDQARILMEEYTKDYPADESAQRESIFLETR